MVDAGVLLGVVLVPLLVLLLVVVLGLRWRSRPVRTLVRRFNRAFTNPRALTSAGSPSAYASVVRHVGRTCGRRYQTPLVPVATDGGFLVPLPYGPGTDWLENVMGPPRPTPGGGQDSHDTTPPRRGHARQGRRAPFICWGADPIRK